MCLLWASVLSLSFTILVSVIYYCLFDSCLERAEKKHKRFYKAHKIVLGRRNLWNGGVDCCRAVMVMSKQGQDSEWRGVSVFCVCVFVCLRWDAGYVLPYLSVWLWVATHVWLYIGTCGLPLSSPCECVCGYRCEQSWIKNRVKQVTALGIYNPLGPRSSISYVSLGFANLFENVFLKSTI